MSIRTMTMPDLGEGVVEAEIVTWFVKVGDTVTTETAIAEVLTDKTSVEVSAPVDGVVAELLVEEGTTVTVGTDLVRIEVDGAAAAAEPTAAAPGEPDGSTTGPAVAEPPPAPAPPATAPAPPATAPAPTTTAPEPARAPAAPEPEPTASPAAGRPLAAPTVRQRARQLGVDLARVAGSGPGGRIQHADLDAHVAGASTVAAAPRRPDVTEQVKGVRRMIAQRLGAAWEAPHITCVDEVDVTELEALRATLKEELPEDAPALTLLPFIARAVAAACADHPRVNATYDAAAESLTLHGSVHLGVATQTERGLLVPVVRDADRRSLRGLAGEIRAAAQEARDGTADRERLGGSTITITSLGALGGLMNTPILNAPEVAIVGVNKLRTVPVWDGSSFVPRTVLNLSASFDHRIIDGWDAAVFLQRVKELLETPALLTLGWAA